MHAAPSIHDLSLNSVLRATDRALDLSATGEGQLNIGLQF
jgi:hypothetical protein